MYKIKAIAPTAYQRNSLRWFGMKIQEVGDGSYFSEQIFDTEEEAKSYLRTMAINYYENEDKLNDALNDIERGVLEIDTVVARIEEIFEEQ